MQRRVGCLGRVADDASGVGGAPDRLGAQERDLACAERPRGVGVAGQLGCELGTGGLAEETASDDRGAKAEERRFIGQRLQPVADDGSDQQMYRIRTEVDRGTDDPLPGRGRLSRGRGLRDGQDGVESGPLVAPPR